MRRACRTALVALLALAVAGCGPTSAETAPPPTAPPPSTTASPTPAPTATETPIPPRATVVPTATPLPKPVRLRRRCGRDYAVRADEPIELLYGGWGVWVSTWLNCGPVSCRWS